MSDERATTAVVSAVAVFKDHLQQAEVMQRLTPIIFDDAKTYWIWSKADMCYVHADTTDILNGLMTNTGDRTVINTKVKNEVMEAIRMTGRARFKKTEPVPEHWIQFKDCVFDLNTGETFPATEKYFYINPIPHNLGKGSETPVVDRLLREWVGDKYSKMMYEILGYAFYNGYPIHRIFALFGSGRNGKGQFIHMLKKLVGTHNICSTSIERLGESRFESNRLRGKHVAFIGETNFATLTRTGELKGLSGGDPYPIEYKGGAGMDMINTAKIVIATNSLPVTADKTRGFYARWLIVDFPNEFVGGKPVIDEISDGEYENLCRKCVTHLQELLKRGKFDQEGDIDARAAKYEATSDPMTTFIRDMCVEGWDEAEPTFNFVNEYKAWCVTKKFRIGSDKAIRNSVNEHYQFESKHEWIVGGVRKQWQAIIGIRLRNSEFSETLSEEPYQGFL